MEINQFLKAIDIERYKNHLLRKKLGLSQATVARKLSSISSLFNYLANEAEYDKSYMYQNSVPVFFITDIDVKSVANYNHAFNLLLTDWIVISMYFLHTN